MSRRVSVDLLAACHADSELLEILTLSQNFRYREPLSRRERSHPRHAHVILGAAAFNFANLFDAVRHRERGRARCRRDYRGLENTRGNSRRTSCAGIAGGMAFRPRSAGRAITMSRSCSSKIWGWTRKHLSIVHAYVSWRFCSSLHDLEAQYQGFFILDATGRFLLWNYGCQRRLGYYDAGDAKQALDESTDGVLQRGRL